MPLASHASPDVAAPAKLPRGSRSLPYGDTLAIFRDPFGYARRQVERFGPVFALNFLGAPTVAMLGAEAQKYVLFDNARNFLWRAGYGPTYELYGGGLLVSDDEEHDSAFRRMAPAFHGRNMPDYLARMNRVIDARLDAWGDAGEVSVYPEARQIAFHLASSLLLGVEVGGDYERLQWLWGRFSRGLATVVHADLPFTTYGKALAARRELTPMLQRIVTERRAQPTSDALGLLVAAGADGEGDSFTDEELIAQMRLLLFAGYDTTSGTLIWLLAELLAQPALLDRARAEVGADQPGARTAAITLDDLRTRPLLDALIDETLRLHPQGFIMPRGAREGFSYAGYDIPAGWHALLIPTYTHRMGEYFADPDRFDPDRFLAPREEDRAHPYAYVGFGGGGRKCIGEGIARIEIKAMLTRLLRRFELWPSQAAQVAGGVALDPMYIPINRPKQDFRIRYRAR